MTAWDLLYVLHRALCSHKVQHLPNPPRKDVAAAILIKFEFIYLYGALPQAILTWPYREEIQRIYIDLRTKCNNINFPPSNPGNKKQNLPTV